MRLLLHGYGEDLGPLPIVAACDKVNAQINRQMDQRVRFEAWKGICGALGIAVIALAIGWSSK
jgi:hypothetical protein